MVVESWPTFVIVVSQNGSGDFFFLSKGKQEIAVDCGDDVCCAYSYPASSSIIICILG